MNPARTNHQEASRGQSTAFPQLLKKTWWLTRGEDGWYRRTTSRLEEIPLAMGALQSDRRHRVSITVDQFRTRGRRFMLNTGVEKCVT